MKSRKSMHNAIIDSWRLFISTIYFVLIIIILSFGYLLLGDNVQAFFNQKKYTKEELKQIAKRVSHQNDEANWDKVVKGIHVRTGLHADPNLNIVIATCTSCHSSKLITQNKATRDGWKSMIKWMQETQGLPDLGKSEPIILDYLAKYYAPTDTGRRKNIDIAAIEWFVLNLDDFTK